MLTYRSHHGNREVITVEQELETTVMGVFMGYLDKVVAYAIGADQRQDNRELAQSLAPVSLNRPEFQNTIRQMEKELAVDFLARRMAPSVRDQ